MGFHRQSNHFFKIMSTEKGIISVPQMFSAASAHLTPVTGACGLEGRKRRDGDRVEAEGRAVVGTGGV